MVPQIKKMDSLLTITVDDVSFIEDRYLINHLEANGYFDGSIDRVEINLRYVSHINSLVITEIIHIYNRFADALHGGELKMALVDLQPAIMNILRLMRVDPFLELRPLA
jgi:anti-anti-sigma regulatory factor